MLLLTCQSKKKNRKNRKEIEPCSFSPRPALPFEKWTYRIFKWLTRAPLHPHLWYSGTLKRHWQASTSCVLLSLILVHGEKLLYTLHYSSTCLNHNPRLAPTHLGVDPSQKNSNWTLVVSQSSPFQPPCGATINAPRGVLKLDKPSTKQSPPTVEDRYERSLNPLKYIG